MSNNVFSIDADGMNELKRRLDAVMARAAVVGEGNDVGRDFLEMAKVIQYAGRALVSQAEKDIQDKGKNNRYRFIELMRDENRAAWGVLIKESYVNDKDGRSVVVNDMAFAKREFKHKYVNSYDASTIARRRAVLPVGLFDAFIRWSSDRGVAERMVEGLTLMVQAYDGVKDELAVDSSYRRYGAELELQWHGELPSDVPVSVLCPPGKFRSDAVQAKGASFKVDKNYLYVKMNDGAGGEITLHHAMSGDDFLLFSQLVDVLPQVLDMCEAWQAEVRKGIEDAKAGLRKILAKEVVMMKIDDISIMSGDVEM
jgi:hypothetical protein